MKCQVNIAVTAAVGILVVIGISSFSLVYQSQTVLKGMRERNVIDSVNQMEFVKKSVNQVAIYSVYQAAYNVSKYGTYKFGTYDTFDECGTSDIDSTLLDNIPKDLPYWRIFGNPCFDITEFPSSPSQIQTEIIKPWLENEILDRFNEYRNDIEEEYKITIPAYTINTEFTDDNTFSVHMTTDDSIKFDDEYLKLSTKIGEIVNAFKLPIKRLVDSGIGRFIAGDDPFPEEIRKAEQSLGRIIVGKDFKDGRLMGNCKSLVYTACINPRETPDFTYNLPTKSEMLPTSCESEFETRVRTNIDYNLDDRTTTTDISVEPKFVNTVVDVDDETICITGYTADFSSCDCIEWKCRGYYPVRIGDTIKYRDPTEQIVTQTDICAQCTNGVGQTTCEQYADKTCPDGFTWRDIDSDGVLEDNECIKTLDRICSNPDTYLRGTSCYRRMTCLIDQACDEIVGCYDLEGAPGGLCYYDPTDTSCPPDTIEVGRECWQQTSPTCPSGTIEINDDLGIPRCYSINQISDPDTCSLHKTSYVKNCEYNYHADVATLVKLKDLENRYPVYDPVERTTDSRNLDLQFYVLSKN